MRVGPCRVVDACRVTWEGDLEPQVDPPARDNLNLSEEVADFVTLLEPQIELDVDTCQNLLTGILYATRDFTLPNSSYLAFEMAGILMKKGAKRAMPVTSQPNTVQNPSNYFPPQQPVAQVSQPVQPPMPRQEFAPVQHPQPMQPAAPQPMQEFVPQPQFVQPQPMMQQSVSQPMPQQEFSPMPQAPVMPQQEFAPIQSMQQVQPQPQPQETPADWLTPKVYKGSTVL